MKVTDLRSARLKAGWSQAKAAYRLRVSQPYVAMLESGERRLTPRLARRARKVFRLPPTALPLPQTPETRLSGNASQTLAEELAALGYDGFAYLRQRRRWKKNPAEVLVAALAQSDLEARVVEALPWLLLRYRDMDAEWLVSQAKLRDLQNRLGFVVTLARQVAEREEGRDTGGVQALAQLEAALERSRLARSDTLCKASLTPREEQWLKENRPAGAERWNLLTDWRAEALPYAH